MTASEDRQGGAGNRQVARQVAHDLGGVARQVAQETARVAVFQSGETATLAPLTAMRATRGNSRLSFKSTPESTYVRALKCAGWTVHAIGVENDLE